MGPLQIDQGTRRKRGRAVSGVLGASEGLVELPAHFGLAEAGGFFHMMADLGGIAMKSERFHGGGGVDETADAQQIQKEFEGMRLPGSAQRA